MAFRHGLTAACARSPLFWINAFVWTYRQKRAGADGVERPITGALATVPFITWPVQDEAVRHVLQAEIDGADLNIEKSRDMGASWLLLAIADHHLLFRENAEIGLVSRVENVVDSKGNMDTLFEKIRYIHRHLPPWMLPRDLVDRYMYIANKDLNSAISGESTNANVGRGGRKAIYIVDEAAAIPNGEDVEASLSQNTACQIWVSTPRGPLTTFHKRIREKRGRHIQMPWWRHPEKSIGAREVMDEMGRIKWTSPWYEALEPRYSRRTIAREVDMDHGQSGDVFFDYSEIERHRRDHEAEPLFRGDLFFLLDLGEKARTRVLQQQKHDEIAFQRTSNGPWRFWVRLRNGRPPQHLTYAFGADIGNGTGGSNSVLSVYALENRMLVAKYWSAEISPEKLASLTALAGVWFGGCHAPVFACWENNGPGSVYGRKLVDMRYPHYYRQRMESTVRRRKTPRWGWHSTDERKQMLLGEYRDALARDDIIVPCHESLAEAEDYIYDEQGKLVPARLREEATGGRALHGDHVIADALAYHAGQELPKQRRAKPPPPVGSFAHRRATAKRRQRRERTRSWP